MVCYWAMEHNNDMLVYGKFSLKKHQHSLNAGCVSGSGLSTLHVLSHLFSSGSWDMCCYYSHLNTKEVESQYGGQLVQGYLARNG